ncbi:integral membrane protein [Phlegmacium glaucopus]|nr:integral membrane protein [Phlegmacium glaucopus]
MTVFSVPPYLDWPVQFCFLLTVVTWLVSIVTSNVSQVDRLWTFLPTIYTAYYALLPLWPNTQKYLFVPYTPKDLGWVTVKDYSPRALLMFGLILTWILFRLSYNTYRRGLFSLHDEDYRWAVLRKQIPAWLFQITNLTFIAATQNALLLLLGLPTYSASVLQPHTPLATSDYTLAALALVVLLFEFTADNQQYAFHAYKHDVLAKEKGDSTVDEYNPSRQWPGARLAWTKEDAHRGFVTRGLWRYSRHPNCACEQTFWWIITLMPLLSPSPRNLLRWYQLPPLRMIMMSVMNPDLHRPFLDNLYITLLPALRQLLPALALSALFISSTLFTEGISSSKYPAYKAYQRRVAMFLPLMTLIKALKIKLIYGEKEAKETERLVWGKAHVKKE